MKYILFFAGVLLCAPWLLAQPPSAPEVYYVGNMGVAIVKNDSVILIDALHDYYDVYYLPSDSSLLEKIRRKEKPFRHLTAIISTHQHNDHFDERMITKLSQLFPEASIVMGQQPAGLLGAIPSPPLRVVNQQGTVSLHQRLTISLLNIGHVGARHSAVENYRIELVWGEHRFVHLGDAASADKTFYQLLTGADVAIVPDWLCHDEQDIKKLEQQKFKAIIATHISPSSPAPFGKSSIPITGFHRYGQKMVVE